MRLMLRAAVIRLSAGSAADARLFDRIAALPFTLLSTHYRLPIANLTHPLVDQRPASERMLGSFAVARPGFCFICSFA